MNTALIIFAKAPVAGQAKTRLMPALGAEGSARLAQQLLMHAVQQAAQVPWAALELCVSPDTSHPAVAQAQNRAREKVKDTDSGRLTLSLQGDGDLGQRMHRALLRGLSRHTAVMLMGTDAPGLNATVLQEAAQALMTRDAVFVPALDGGYALVGLRRPAPELFEGMVWSTPEVMAHTRQRARQAGLQWAELPALADIDEPADLVHLPSGWVLV